MKSLRFLGKLACCVAVCASLAGADSLQLRNGRHLQGKYIGGTTNAIGFMTSGTVEYFATSDVLALLFDNGNEPLSGLQPNPMKGQPPEPTGGASMRQISAPSRNHTRHAKLRTTAVSTSQVHPDSKLD
jgi:hypothetical protein